MTVSVGAGDQPPVKPSDATEAQWTEEADTALSVWVNRTRATVRSTAESIAEHERILKKDVHAATERFELAQAVYTKRSDWAKWAGFLALGIFIPNLLILWNTPNADRTTIVWTFIPAAIAIGLLAYAWIRDFDVKKKVATRKKSEKPAQT